MTAPASRLAGWAWVVIVVLLLADLVLRGSGPASLAAGAVLLITAGAAYVLWLRPRVVPTREGVRLVNPLRDTFVPWQAFTWADVTDVLRIHADGRVFRSWPLRETKRARVRENLRRAGDGPVPAPDADPRTMSPVDLAARDLRAEAERRRAELGGREAGGGTGAGGSAVASAPRGPTTVWGPDALVALGAPVALLVVVLLMV
ncbi:hypothetical protein HNR25_003088 [Streptomonospora salina]|uniref:PH domain-containing protein n=1 Tax=Streptomonospora salina TaxID=104205 RepID=A0A841E606_9ACTN|nr:hypothetical protein [Streptomonospora salina]